jgi:hypothetical protein
LSDAAKLTLAAEFETENEDEVIKKILEKGNVQETQVCYLSRSPLIYEPRLILILILVPWTGWTQERFSNDQYRERSARHEIES